MARTVAHHELLHMGQFLRNPNIATGIPFGPLHELIPSFVGTPEIYLGGSSIFAGIGYGIYKTQEP